jgi:hypothetical protein
VAPKRRRSDGYMTGMLGLYLTAAELVRRGFIVSPTSRSAIGADLLVTDRRCRKAWSVQVKTNASTSKSWLVNPHSKRLRSLTHVYVFVTAPKDDRKDTQFFVVPSHVVARKIVTTPPRSTGSIWHAYHREDRYRDNWKLFGKP